MAAAPISHAQYAVGPAGRSHAGDPRTNERQGHALGLTLAGNANPHRLGLITRAFAEMGTTLEWLTGEPPSDGRLFMDDGSRSPPFDQGWDASMAVGAYDPGLPEIIGQWFGEAPGQCLPLSCADTQGQTWALLPVAVFADSLGLWANRPLETLADLTGLRISADPTRFGFLRALGVEFVEPTGNTAGSATQTDAVDLMLSCGAAQDRRQGLFGAPWRCYSPGLRNIVALAWLALPDSAALLHD
ncbi:MAG: hypothetical protein R3E83_12600, partial [Burkholderiaceae bacterium]